MKKEVREVSQQVMAIREKTSYADYDDTFGMENGIIRDTIQTCNSTGVPKILHFEFMSGDKKYFELDVPFLPVNYSLKSPEDVRDFTKYGNPEYSKAVQRDLGEEEVDSRTTDYINQIMNYICHELAKGYIEKKQKKEFKIAGKIKNLKIMQDFDLEPEGKQLEGGGQARPLEVRSFKRPVTNYKGQNLICAVGLVKKGEDGKLCVDPKFDDEKNINFTNVLNYLSTNMFYYTDYEPQFHAYGE